MALTLGGSSSSSYRSLQYLKEAKSNMDKTLARISSGKKILSGADDPGGLAVAMKLQSQISNTNAQSDVVENAKSYVEAQSTALETAAEIVTKMKDLKADYADPANVANQSAYEAEFQDLRIQLESLKGETLSGTKLFNRTDGDMTVSNITLTNLDLDTALQDGGQNLGNPSDPLDAVTLSTITDDNLSNILDDVSGLVAEAAGDSSTLGFASDYLSNMSVNLEAAHGRIMDIDLAEETANYAAQTMQYEAAAAAVAQANTSTAVVMDLLLSSMNRD
jgi:flagellin